MTALTAHSPVRAADGAPPAQLAASLSNDEAWSRLPEAESGGGQPLPSWACMLAGSLPRSTAALLELDYAQRTQSPVDPQLRAAMRWVAAHANRCEYAQHYAAFDAQQAGVSDELVEDLAQADFGDWSAAERAALHFARTMSVDSDAVTDAEFAKLVEHFGDRQAASMVLLMAYANFQDRLLLCLAAPMEEDGPLPPVNVRFSRDALTTRATASQQPPSSPIGAAPPAEGIVAADEDWSAVSYDDLQLRLEQQRSKPTRLPVPDWEDFASILPEGLFRGPSDIVWYRIVFGYAPELAIPYELFMRTAGAETSPQWDRVFGSSLFWVVTRAVECPYCMGHCEMNWEVAGLTREQIAETSRLLSGDDWSAFPPEQQRAFAFARKLSRTPWEIASPDVAALQQDFGPERALFVALHASRYHYMTRISNGFQLTLERDNVFYAYWNVKPDEGAEEAVPSNEPWGPVLTDAECWDRLPEVATGRDQPLPIWARAVAVHLPRTAAAMLKVDHAHRTLSPLDPQLRAKMRWVVAKSNRCEYSQAYALADLARLGASADAIAQLTGNPADWPDEDRDALEFARLLTLAAPTIPDEFFEKLRARYGNREVAAMVLLAAFGNYQDRIVLGLNLPIEEGGPLPPVDVTFADGALQVAAVLPQNAEAEYLEDGQNLVEKAGNWGKVSYDELQVRLEGQRSKSPRLPIPGWEEVKPNLPEAMAARPTRIVWSLTCLGYVPELAVPWSVSTRTLWSEAQTDRIFEESLFWVQTRAIECNYCMGHCEMLLEVAGLDKEQIAQRTRMLAGDDWSAFPPAEQRAYAYARKLSRTPWELTESDYRTLESDLGSKEALAKFWWLCRGLYMTRVSDGFQLPLERDNVFADYGPPPANKPN